MKVSVIIGVLMLGLAMLWKALGPGEASSLLLWLTQVMVVVVTFLLVFGAAGALPVLAISEAEGWQAWRRSADMKKNPGRRWGGLCYGR